MAELAESQSNVDLAAPARLNHSRQRGATPTPTLRTWVLGSGSKGNATLVEADESRLLIDAGFELPDLVARLRTVGVAPATIDDVVLTHGHRDHVLGAAHGARIYGWRVWAALGTAWRWRALRHIDLQPFEPGDTFTAGRFTVGTAATPHDIDDSVAVLVGPEQSAQHVGYCTDLGAVPPAVEALLGRAATLVLESNYDAAMLAAGPYPPELRARVAGPTGHLSNADAAALLARLASPALRHVVLAHISQHNNTPQLALATAAAAIATVAYAGTLTAACQDHPVGPFDVAA